MELDNIGALPALRGYRKQFLYTLGRILNSNGEVCCPEKLEDLSVYNENGKLLELIQVKDHSAPLTFSSLNSFLNRAVKEIENQPDVKVTLATFGPVGQEIRKILQAKKIDANSKFYGVREAIQRLKVKHIQEANEQQSIMNVLFEQPTLSGDTQSAFDILMQSLYIGSELGQIFTKKRVLEHIQKIGTYLVGREAHHQEWGRSILPLMSSEGASVDKLRKEFSQGVGARWEHITAQIDAERPQYLKSIKEGFQKSNVTIIHGVSGQGKSTLAYRFLHDFCSSTTRYEIRDITTPERALKIAAAMRGYGSNLPVPLTLYADISYADKGIEELIKQVTGMAHIRLLITIREEDWRLVSLSKADHPFSDVELGFNESEARQVFEHVKNSFPDFAQAWSKFGGEGPLLEFVYLLNHTETLRERLTHQYNQIADSNRSDDLKVLEYVALAGSCGARIDLSKLKETIPAASLKRIIHRLESEYLVRENGDGAWLSGLHPIRSTILTDIFIDPVIKCWREIASECLPILLDADIEIFLLHTFVAHPEAEEPILTYIKNTRLPSWKAVGGVVRALLWKGVYNFIRNNRELINEVREVVGDGVWLLLDFDLIEMQDSESAWESIANLLPTNGKERAQHWRRQQRPKAEAFSELNTWLKVALPPKVQCEDEYDWRALGETAYWVSASKQDVGLFGALDWQSLPQDEELPLKTLGTFIYGTWHAFSTIPEFIKWYEKLRPKLIARYQAETLTPYIEIKDKLIRAHFIVSAEDEQVEKNGINLHQQGIEHVELLAQLFPEFEKYGCQGYGHMLLGFLEYDETTKTGIDCTYLRPDWVVQVNKTARILSGHESRPEIWQEYCDQMMVIRQANVQCLKELQLNLSKHFRSKKVVQNLVSLSESPLWKESAQKITRPPSFPVETLDQWGFTEEGGESSNTAEQTQQNKPQSIRAGEDLQRFSEFLKKKSELFSGISTFINQVPPLSIAFSYLGKAKTKAERLLIEEKLRSLDIYTDKPFLAGYNLFEAIQALPEFQRLYRQHFPSLTDLMLLDKLEQEERSSLISVWRLWYFFVADPSIHWLTPVKASASRLEKEKTAVLKAVDDGVCRASSSTVVIKRLPHSASFENEPAIWITIDCENAVDSYVQFEELYKQIRLALREVKLHSLKNYALQLLFSRLIVVPLLRGKVLESWVWVLPSFRFHSEQVVGNDLSKLDQLLRPIAFEILTHAGLEEWKSPQLSTAMSLFRGVATIQTQLSHIIQIAQMPEVDQVGQNVMQTYFSSLQQSLSQHMQQIFDSCELLAHHRDGLAEHSNPQYKEYLEEAFTCISGVFDILKPEGLSNGKMELDIEKMKEWRAGLESVQGEVLTASLLWAAYLVSSLQEPITEGKVDLPSTYAEPNQSISQIAGHDSFEG